MPSKRFRLDRFISLNTRLNRRDVRVLISQGRIAVDGRPASSISQVIDQFSRIVLDNKVLQAEDRRYIMLNKPKGVVSATKDDKHPTALGLLNNVDGKAHYKNLHIVGRLDFNSTGLLLLTNDGQWSRKLSEPENQVAKVYRVTLENPIDETYVSAFSEGMYFPFEGITTRPAILRIVDTHVAEVTLFEGRYHQIKRMFGRFRNRVLDLHRVAVGGLCLDEQSRPGHFRDLSREEANSIFQLCQNVAG